MKTNATYLSIFAVLVIALYSAQAQADQQWIPIKDPEEVKTLISGRAIDGKHWVEYYRADGNMAYLNRPADSLVIRKWTVNEKGELCTSVFSKPEYTVDCYKLQRTPTEPAQYRGTHKMGVSEFVFLDQPPKKLSDAINEKAGAE